jgi:hypothetical protein
MQVASGTPVARVFLVPTFQSSMTPFIGSLGLALLVNTSMLWLGRPQCGKSSTSHTIAQVSRREGRLGSATFLVREVEGRNNPSTLFSTMARDLAAFDDKIKEGICHAIETGPSLPFACIERQFQDLIIGPTQNLTIVWPMVIDELDECEDIKDRARLLLLYRKNTRQVRLL